MADDLEEELDVEGIDEDCPPSLSLGIDPDELPSSSSHLPPELSQHPWLVFSDQLNTHIPDVALHDDIDENSRITITQMIQEEHTYLQQHKLIRPQTKGAKTVTANSKKVDRPVSHNMRWTAKEKELFEKGVEMFGHRWKEIADLIHTRSHNQVKSYARTFFLSQTGPNNKSLTEGAERQSKRKQTTEARLMKEGLCPTMDGERWGAEGEQQQATEGVQPLHGEVQLAARGVQLSSEGETVVTKVVQPNAMSHEGGAGAEDGGIGFVADRKADAGKEEEAAKLGEEDEESDIEIDVEDDSDDELKDSGCLQAAQLFGDILRNPGHGSSAVETLSSGLSEVPSVARVTSSDPLRVMSGDIISSTSLATKPPEADCHEVQVSPQRATVSPEDEPLGVWKSRCNTGCGTLEKEFIHGTDGDSAVEDDGGVDALTICLSLEGTRNMRRGRKGKGSPRKRPGGKRRSLASEDDVRKLAEGVVSTEATPVSDLPGNFKHGDVSFSTGHDVPHVCNCSSMKGNYLENAGDLASVDVHSHGTSLCENPKCLASAKNTMPSSQVVLCDNESVLTLGSSTSMTQHQRPRKVRNTCKNSREGVCPLNPECKTKCINSEHSCVPSADDKSGTGLSNRLRVATGEDKTHRESEAAPLWQQSNDRDLKQAVDSTTQSEMQLSPLRERSTDGDSVNKLQTKDGPQSECAVESVSNARLQHQGDGAGTKGDEKLEENEMGEEDKVEDEASENEGDEFCDANMDDSSQEGIGDLPKEEVTLDGAQVTEGEKTSHPEFFDFKSNIKTPARYLVIRNHIIKCWHQTKPAYLNKTTVRSGLRNAGDVNAIGSIHTYLESIGAINFGTSNPFQSRLKRRRSTIEKWARDEGGHKVSMRPRREVKQAKVYLESTIKPDKMSDDKQKRIKRRQLKAPAYDPFKLVECSTFSADSPAPFLVKVKGDVIVTMDLHAHLSTTEVIGLLGGKFDAEGSILDVRLARPCKSLSTGMQCEMDPVSQTEACEEISLAGHTVVGWYHSHPTFSPNPSIRDIETQQNFQEWFSQDAKTPFIGVIVSPYSNRQSTQSKVNYLTISKEWSTELHTWKPYKFDVSTYQARAADQSHQQIIDLATKLIKEFSLYKYRVEMLWVCPVQSGITYLEKMLQSLGSNLCGDEEEKGETISRLRLMVFELFGTKCSNVVRDSTLDVPLSFDSSP